MKYILFGYTLIILFHMLRNEITFRTTQYIEIKMYNEIFRPSPKQDPRQAKSGNPNIPLSFTGTIANVGSGGGAASFQDFQESVDDAWDSGDDEFWTVSDVKISKRVSHSAALSVINSHRSSASCGDTQSNTKDFHPRQATIIPDEKRAEALQRLAVQPLHLRNAQLNTTTLSSSNHNQHVSGEDNEGKFVNSPGHRPTHFPGRPQPLKQTSSASKFFVPSKEQGLFFNFVFSGF